MQGRTLNGKKKYEIIESSHDRIVLQLVRDKEISDESDCKIEGPYTINGKLVGEMFDGNEYIFKATEYRESSSVPTENIRWAEQLNDGCIAELRCNKGVNPYMDKENKVCFKYNAKKAATIRVYAYLVSPSKASGINVPVVTFPFCLDRYKIPGLNQSGDNIAEDLTYGKGVAVKSPDTVYDNKTVEQFKNEYIAKGFDIKRHALFANAGDEKRENPFKHQFEQLAIPANSDYFATFQHGIDKQNRAKIMQQSDEFDKGSYNKAIYSKEQIYNAKAWIKKLSYTPSGGDVKDYHDGNILFWDTSDDNLFKAFEDWATMCFSYGKMQGNLKRMIAKFKRNEGGVYEDHVLTKDIAEHSKTIEYFTALEDYIAEKIKLSNGKFSSLIENEIDFDSRKRSGKGKTITNFDTDVKPEVFTRPRFSSILDNLKGETIALNDIWATEVLIQNIKFNGAYYTITYKVNLWDHFGLDFPDLEKLPNMIPFAKEAFAVWFALQHLRGYKPFITKMSFEKTFSGYVNEGRIERAKKRSPNY
jgi:hypothetical protein